MIPVTLQGLPPLVRLQKLKELQQKITTRVKAVERNLHSIEIQEKQEFLEIEAMILESSKELEQQQENPFDEPLSPREFNHEQTKANTLIVNLPPNPLSTPISKTRNSTTLPTATNANAPNTTTQTSTTQTSTVHSASTLSTLDDLTTSHQSIPTTEQNILVQPSQAASLNYYAALHERPLLYLRENMEQLYTQVQTRGYLLWEQHELAQNVASALENKVQDLQSGKYIPTDPASTQEHIDITQKIAQTILGMQPVLNQSQQKDWYKGT